MACEGVQPNGPITSILNPRQYSTPYITGRQYLILCYVRITGYAPQHFKVSRLGTRYGSAPHCPTCPISKFIFCTAVLVPLCCIGRTYFLEYNGIRNFPAPFIPSNWHTIRVLQREPVFLSDQYPGVLVLARNSQALLAKSWSVLQWEAALKNIAVKEWINPCSS